MIRVQLVFRNGRAADTGCFIVEDVTACMTEHCIATGFGACLDDLP